MCGVCGVVGRGLDADRVRVQAMMDAMLHRGPDESGIGGPAHALLGVTRLAIRGVDSGRQPIIDADTGVIAVCNGEIDNHAELRDFLASRGRRVEMRTDVAVIPALYLELGEDFVKELVGAFALALYDPRHRRLILARDRAGERPLFYMRTEDGVTFATEISALATDRSLRLTVDRNAVARYMRFGSFTAPASPFFEIRKVAPAERIVFEGGAVRCERTWRWPVGHVAKKPASLDRFDTIFRRAVHLQSENDVPFGVFLSGGVDSSLVTAVAKTLRPDADFSAYTLRFSEASYDEGDAAALVARTLGVRAVPVWVGAGDFPRELSRLISMVGEPLADPAWIPTALLARRAAEDVKVALVGEGADELFGGYPTYIGALVGGRYASLPRWIKAPIRRAVEAWPPGDKKVTLSFLLKKFVAGAELTGGDRHLLWTSNIPPDLLRRLGVQLPVVGMDALPSILDSVQRHDLETSLAEGLLTKADRASMSSALELRAPFLDRDVMEFAATLREDDRVRGVKTKLFLKRYAIRYLPARIVHRKKRGLSVPLAGWLREELYDWAAERLGDPGMCEVGVDPNAALTILKEHRGRKADHARAIWTLAVLSEWLGWVASIRRNS